MDETIVDPDLEAFLKQDLGKNTERVQVEGDEISVDDSEEDTDITTKTKAGIARKFCDMDVSDSRPAKLMNMLMRLDGFTEKQAKMYLEALKLTENITISDDLITTVIKLAASITVNPRRPDIIQKISTDKHVKRSVSLMCSDLFDLIGSISGSLVFILYSIISWQYDRSTDNASSTFPTDDSISVSNGKDNTSNKTS